MKTIHPGHLEHRFCIFECQILCIPFLAIMPQRCKCMTVPIWWPWPPVTFSWDSVWILMREPRKCTRQYEKIILSVRIRKILPAQKLWKRTNCSLHLSLMIGSIRCLYHYTTYTSAMWSHVEIVLRLASCSRGVQWVVLALA